MRLLRIGQDDAELGCGVGLTVGEDIGGRLLGGIAERPLPGPPRGRRGGFASPAATRIWIGIREVLRRVAVVLVLGFVGEGVRGAEAPGPLSPEQSRGKMRLADEGLVVELVVSEPAVNSPVAMTWDAEGVLYVVEMSDYPTADTGGKIKRLQDRDGDGRYETVTTFAEGLKFPNGSLAWNNGLLVTCAPDILYFKDLDGDGRADERRVILTGFAEGNQQLRVNGLFWGLDNWVYGANGRSGGEIRRPNDPATKAVPIRRHDFRFRPETGEFEALAGFSQFGLGRDDFNRRFLSWNTVPFRHAVIEERDLVRNPYYTSGNSIALIAEASDTGRVYPISAPPKTFNRERTDYFNASCGSMLFRGTGLGPQYQGNAFVGEPLTNLVHRKVLEPRGATFVAKRGEQQQEFLASQDSWFHPVSLATGPDGCLYVADFYREWVEHPQFVQPALRTNVNFRTGNEHGRIWRVRRKDFSPPPLPPAGRADLAKHSAAELARDLDCDNSWIRDTAQRLIVERQDPAAVPALEALVTSGTLAATRAQALWTLAGLKALRGAHIDQALKDVAPAVREQGIVLERLQNPPAGGLTEQVLRLAADGDPRVRFEVALAAGDLDSADALSALSQIASRDGEDEWLRAAILSGLGKSGWRFLQTLAREHPGMFKTPSAGQLVFLGEVAGIIGAGTGAGAGEQSGEIAGLCGLLGEASATSEGAAFALLSGLGDGLARRNNALHRLLEKPAPELQPHLAAVRSRIAAARRSAADRHVPESQRLLAFRILAQTEPGEARALVLPFLSGDESPAMQAAAAGGLAEVGDAELARQVIERWASYPINTRRELISALLRKVELANVLLDSLEEEKIGQAEIDFTAREAISRLPKPELQARAAKLLKVQESGDRDAVVNRYQAALELKGEPARGALLFSKDCVGCHQIQGKGARVGPELSGIASRPKAALLIDILHPSKEVSPDFVNYVVVTKRGQLFTGLLAADTAAAVRLRRIQGAEDTILRTEIEELRPNGKSLMPDGFEEKFTPQDLAHLLEFLQHPVPLPAVP